MSVIASSIASRCADSAIGAYQRYISPYKGFCCAHRAHTGKRSCSAYGRAIVQKLGLLALLVALPRQFERCKLAYQSILKRKSGAARYHQKQRKNSVADCCDPVELSCEVLDLAGALPCDCSF